MKHKLAIRLEGETYDMLAGLLNRIACQMSRCAQRERNEVVLCPTGHVSFPTGAYVIQHDNQDEGCGNIELSRALEGAKTQVTSHEGFVRLSSVDVGTIKLNGKTYTASVILRQGEGGFQVPRDEPSEDNA